MKLLKLQSEEVALSEAVFTNNIYSGGYTLPANAQIALKNISMDFDNPVYLISSTGDYKNNDFVFQTSNSSIHNIELDAGEYTLRDLMIEIKTKMNNKLNPNVTTEKGFEWSIGKELDSRGNLNLIFAFDRTDSIILNSATVQNVGIDYNAGSAYFYKNIADNGSYNAHLSGNTFVTCGGFQVSTTIKAQNSNDPALSNWIFGIDENKSTYTFSVKSNIVNVMWACIANNAGKYSFKIGGSMVQGTVSPVSILANDVITIKKDGLNIIYTILQGSTTHTVVGDNINDLLNLIGVSNLGYMIHIGDDTGKIAFNTNVMTPTPFSKVASGVYTFVQPEDVQDVYLNTNVSVTSSKVGLLFPNRGTRNLLGFLSPEYYKNALSGSFKGDAGLTIDFLSNDLEIEVIELATMNSYSQASKQLKGIVSVIPISILQSSTIVSGTGAYQLSFSETASFAFLSINNKEVLQLPSLTVRATSNNKIVKLNGNMTVTFLIKSVEEMN